VECVDFPMLLLAHVTAVVGNPLSLKGFVACGFDLIQVSVHFLFNEPDTVSKEFCDCCEYDKETFNMTRLMCNQCNITTRDRDETDSVTCWYSRVLRHLVSLWNFRGIPGLIKITMSTSSGTVSLVSNRSHITHVFISCHVCILCRFIVSSLSTCLAPEIIVCHSFSSPDIQVLCSVYSGCF